MKVRTVANNETCDLQVFENAELGKIRSVVKDGEPWFVGKDVAEILGYTNPSKALLDHVDVEDSEVAGLSTKVDYFPSFFPASWTRLRGSRDG